VDLGRHGDGLVNDSNLAWENFYRAPCRRIIGHCPQREGGEQPPKRIAKDSAQTLATCTMLGALGYFTTLVF
jgi:hypothetical protein